MEHRSEGGGSTTAHMISRGAESFQCGVEEQLRCRMIGALPEAAALLDRGGMIRAVSPAWVVQAELGADPLAPRAIGSSYLESCRVAAIGGDAAAGRAYEGVSGVLAGMLPRFTLEYGRGGIGGERWFSIEAAPLPGGGAIICHDDVTGRRREHDLSLIIGLSRGLRGVTSLDEAIDLLFVHVSAALRAEAVQVTLREPGSNTALIERVSGRLPASGITAVAPLVAGDRRIGELSVSRAGPLDAFDQRLLHSFADIAAATLQRTRVDSQAAQARDELAELYEEAIEGWARALDLREQETEGHSRRVACGAVRLSRALGLPANEICHIYRGALLHDIGKMGVPDVVLRKPGPLSESEWRLVHEHPRYAYELLAPVAYLRPAIAIPRYHHERWDGSGYPHGLQGEEIPIAARIFAVVDAWDAITNHRPYRPARPLEHALAYIRNAAGSHFDPQVSETFLRITMGKG